MVKECSKLIKAFNTTAEENSAINSHGAGLANALMFLPQPHYNNSNGRVNHNHHHCHRHQPHLYGGNGLHVDPHLMCLKLGKRHYFEDTSGAVSTVGGLASLDRRGKGYCGSGGAGLASLDRRGKGSDSSHSPADLSVRCGAALRELIAENRAALMAKQFVPEREWHLHHHAVDDFKVIQPEYNSFPQEMFHQ
ncbi:unnamed protein product [Lupinus luteus]|uniref:Uncharacterized protein n=1 Tax=Lupinus luteus TaxID=3873 RepID=A0AAV1W5W4_LUPLU